MKYCNNKIFPLAALGLWLLASTCLAEVVVVVHPSNASSALSNSEASNIFLGKTSSFPSGDNAVPLDQSADSTARDHFYNVLVKKNPSQLRAYWSRMIFTGKAQPPKEVFDDAEVKELISKNPNLIGYIDSSQIDDTVKVVLRIP